MPELGKLQTEFSHRQTMETSDFELYYYSDTELPGVREHTHDFIELYFLAEGDVRMTILGEVHALRPGDVIFIPPGTPHYVRIHNGLVPYRRFVLWIRPEFIEDLPLMADAMETLPSLLADEGRYIYSCDLILFNTFQSRLMTILEEQRGHRYGRKARVLLTLQDLLLLLTRSVYESSHALKPPENRSLYDNLLTYLDEHLAEDLSLTALSERFYCSKYHLSHLFKDRTGLSLHQYITKKRLSRCCEAILSGLPAAEASRMAGFGEYSSFYRAFSKEYGVSPDRYRQLHSQAPISSRLS